MTGRLVTCLSAPLPVEGPVDDGRHGGGVEPAPEEVGEAVDVLRRRLHQGVVVDVEDGEVVLAGQPRPQRLQVALEELRLAETMPISCSSMDVSWERPWRRQPKPASLWFGPDGPAAQVAVNAESRRAPARPCASGTTKGTRA